MNKHLIILLCAIIGISGLYADSQPELVKSFTLFDSREINPFIINSNSGWTTINSIQLEQFSALPPLKMGYQRKWRIKSSYIDNSSVVGESTIQVKFFQDSENCPTFTLPWTTQVSLWQEEESNWYSSDNPQGLILEKRATLGVKLIAPPHSSTPGKIFKIILEAWDFKLDEKDFKSPSTREASFSNKQFFLSPKSSPQAQIIKDKEQALSVAFQFIEDYLTGDLPNFYKLLSDNIKILNTGYSQSKYQVPPPSKAYGNYSIEDYKRDYNYKIYSYKEYISLFPQWTDTQRRWNPNPNCYLFIGSEKKEKTRGPFSKEPLTFMVEKTGTKGFQIIALPE